MKRSQITNTIALFSRKELNFDFLRFLLKSEEVFNAYNLTPNWIGVEGKGYGDKLRKYKNTRKKLFDTKFATVEGLGIYAIPAESDAPTYDYFAHIGITKADYGYEFDLLIDSQFISLIELKDQMITNFDFVTSFEYGFGYSMDYKYGPYYFAHGSCYNDTQTEEEENLRTKWMYYSYKESFISGLIRDVFELNFLNRSHLDYSVEGKTFELFLKEEKKYGIPEPIGIDLWQWNPPAEEIGNIRQILIKNKMLVVYL